MKRQTLFLSTLLSAGILVHTVPALAADSITTSTVKTAGAPLSKDAINDPRVAAHNFVEHVNYARVALAMKNSTLAGQHITQARNMMVLIKSASSEQRRITNVTSGRIVYQYDTDYKYHYFPIQNDALQTGPMQLKEISNGPVWAKNELAVSDADIVYLTLDLSGDKPQGYLDAASKALTAKQFKEADNQLAMLTDAVVTVDSRVSVPGDKARDNIALTRSFMAAKNYDGARYALKHADEALDEMQRDDTYTPHHTNIAAMRLEVSTLQDRLEKKDPTLLQETDAQLKKWWGELKTWSKKEY
jgi:hypothetical protein